MSCSTPGRKIKIQVMQDNFYEQALNYKNWKARRGKRTKRWKKNNCETVKRENQTEEKIKLRPCKIKNEMINNGRKNDWMNTDKENCGW